MNLCKTGCGLPRKLMWKHFSCSGSKSPRRKARLAMPMTDSKQAKVLPRNTGHCGQREDKQCMLKGRWVRELDVLFSIHKEICK